MKPSVRSIALISCLFFACSCLYSCLKKKEGKVVVIEKEFELRQESDLSWSLDVKGKIKNVGQVDLKKLLSLGTAGRARKRCIVEIGSFQISQKQLFKRMY